MNTVDPIHSDTLRNWLDEGVDVAPERAVRDALLSIQTTRQRRELAPLRRIRPMEITTPAPRWPATRIAAIAAGVLVVALGAALLTQYGPGVGSETAESGLGRVVAGLEAPAGTQAGTLVNGPAALSELFATTRVQEFATLRVSGYEEAAATTFGGAAAALHRYTAAVISFADEAAATEALYAIYRSADEVSAGEWDGGLGFWNLQPGASDPFTAAPDEVRVELTATWTHIGGTSAGDGARAGLLLAWRDGARIYLSAGVDLETVATASLQREIEVGVRALAAGLEASD